MQHHYRCAERHSFDVTLDPSKKDIETAVKEVAEELLVNFNLETYHYEIMEEA